MKKTKTKMKIAVSILLAAMMTSEALAATAPVAMPTSQERFLDAHGNEAVPFWNDTMMVAVTISGSGTTLTPIAIIQPYSDSTKTTGTMYLEKYSSGKWVKVKSWSVSGTGTFTVKKTGTGTPGTEYRTRVVLKVGSDSIEEESNGYVL